MNAHANAPTTSSAAQRGRARGAAIRAARIRLTLRFTARPATPSGHVVAAQARLAQHVPAAPTSEDTP